MGPLSMSRGASRGLRADQSRGPKVEVVVSEKSISEFPTQIRFDGPLTQNVVIAGWKVSFRNETDRFEEARISAILVDPFIFDSTTAMGDLVKSRSLHFGDVEADSIHRGQVGTK